MTTQTLIDPNYSEIVTSELARIVTSRALTLTQDTAAPIEAFQVPKTGDLEVFGDEVTIRGRIEASGRSIRIFARVLTLEAAPTKQGLQPAELNVDGTDASAHSDLGPLAEGATGAAGFNDCIEPAALAGCKWKGGGQGQSANDPNAAWAQGSPDPSLASWQWKKENEWMHGADGKPGNPGHPGGTVVVICDSFGPNTQALILSAKGGRGGAGQRGQDGAKGGDGGPGSNAVGRVGFGSFGYKNATPGGNGGLGGNGGRGGRGGDGGRGGRIVFRCVNAKQMPGRKIQAIADGGACGQPGAGGKPGKAGLKGRGGTSGTWVTPPFGIEKPISGSYDGLEGVEGRTGNVPGEPGNDGRNGSVELSFAATYPQLKAVLRNAVH